MPPAGNPIPALFVIAECCVLSGTFIGCIAALIIIIAMIRAPLLMILVCCVWAGFCTWISSLVRIENSYAWGLSGYTALIIVITIQTEPLLTPQFALERCSEIVIGIGCRYFSGSTFLAAIDKAGG
ncbi:fusaric acid resistance protein FusB/ fusaricacid resistance protein FusC [Salmonella enterica subsp. arizonae]|uniref:Fusaric acid resistance protein FusB/ fusaricacid resistance protein FusC n=1 Tax=Salmonella enterica subsp. arizonae TaxID=59203 RepID=A0A379TJQ4_SALER|nr:fusaric acid resistance protein FusB/ fusaricacid resistance protein FusC [Salmonella enterica subsp. arizonae]